jgi:hypothetical protein
MGTVLDVGVGDPPAGPFGPDLRLGNIFSMQASWLHIKSDNGKEGWIKLIAPGFLSQSQPGDIVRVTAHVASFFAIEGWIELRDADGNLLFWYGEAQDVSALRIPEGPLITLGEGAVQAEVGGECVPHWEQKQLQVELAGATASIGYGEQLALGGWWINNVGVDVQLSQATCPDASATSARAALWPMP